MIKQVGIPLFGFFMIGFPWETKEDIKKTERLIHKINPDFIELHVAMPYYGTGLFEECEKLGVLKESGFGHDYYSPNTKGTVTLSTNEVESLKKKILLRFYLRPNYIAKKMLGAVGQPNIVKNYIRYGLRLLKKNL